MVFKACASDIKVVIRAKNQEGFTSLIRFIDISGRCVVRNTLPDLCIEVFCYRKYTLIWIFTYHLMYSVSISVSVDVDVGQMLNGLIVVVNLVSCKTYIL